jgi:hypothetical protein
VGELVTRRDRANRAASILAERYRGTEYWGVGWPHLTPPRPPAKEIHEALIALGPDPNPDDVDRIMDSKWTYPECDECGEDVDVAVFFDINCGEFSLELCEKCCHGLADRIAAARRDQR